MRSGCDGKGAKPHRSLKALARSCNASTTMAQTLIVSPARRAR